VRISQYHDAKQGCHHSSIAEGKRRHSRFGRARRINGKVESTAVVLKFAPPEPPLYSCGNVHHFDLRISDDRRHRSRLCLFPVSPNGRLHLLRDSLWRFSEKLMLPLRLVL